MNDFAKRYLLHAGFALGACGFIIAGWPSYRGGGDDPKLVNFRGWHAWYEAMRGGTDFSLLLHHVRGLSEVPSGARGRLTVERKRGEVRIDVRELPELPAGAAYRALLVSNRDGAGNTVGLDRGPDGDDVLDLGTLAVDRGHGILQRTIDRRSLYAFDIDMALVVRDTPAKTDEVVVGGLTSLLQKLASRASDAPERHGREAPTAGAWLGRAWRGAMATAAFADAASPESRALLDLAGEGERLFFQETFAGNGRTCGTCHPAQNHFTLNPTFIASLPRQDPLFVAEFMPALAGLENPALMHGPRALILENIDGFANPPVFRATPHILNAALTGPFGLSGEIGSLAEFALGAVVQHFPLSLNRVAGVDFRLPTEDELDAMEAFQQTVFAPPDQVFDVDQFVGTPEQIRGRDLFGTADNPAKKCFQCHSGPVLSDASAELGGGNRSFDTGVGDLPINQSPPPECPTCPAIGPLEAGGAREFSTPPLFGIANTAPFFHDNSAATLRDAVAFYDTVEFNSSPGGVLVGGISLTPNQIDDITAFLQALTTCGNATPDHGEECDDGNPASSDGCRSNCTLEACGDGVLDVLEACDDGNVGDDDGCSATCRLELCGPMPMAGCRQPVDSRAFLRIRNHANDGKDQFLARWEGEATTMAEFGNPLVTTSYVICMYDSSGAPQPLLNLAAPGGGTCAEESCWTRRARQFEYEDKLLTPDGLRRVTLREGMVDGKATLAFDGEGLHLALPTPLQLTTPVTVQVKNTETGVCWSAVYAAATANNASTFRARSD